MTTLLKEPEKMTNEEWRTFVLKRTQKSLLTMKKDIQNMMKTLETKYENGLHFPKIGETQQCAGRIQAYCEYYTNDIEKYNKMKEVVSLIPDGFQLKFNKFISVRLLGLYTVIKEHEKNVLPWNLKGCGDTIKWCIHSLINPHERDEF